MYPLVATDTLSLIDKEEGSPWFLPMRACVHVLLAPFRSCTLRTLAGVFFPGAEEILAIGEESEM
jgi:hypothetical protein